MRLTRCESHANESSERGQRSRFNGSRQQNFYGENDDLFTK